jgi:hypothetical protein
MATETYATVTGTKKELSHEYVEIDTTAHYDCHHLPIETTVIAAIQRTFGEDIDRKTIAPRRSDNGVWRIESPNMQQYRTTEELTWAGKKIAKVTVRKQKVTLSDDGRLTWSVDKDTNDLLVTMLNAYKFPLNQIDEADLLQAVHDMEVGTIKRAPQKQRNTRTKEFNGNKFFILKNVLPADRERVPAELSFDLPDLGKVTIFLTHRYKMRHCYYCGKWHDAICEIRNKSEEIAKEKAAMARGRLLVSKSVEIRLFDTLTTLLWRGSRSNVGSNYRKYS